MNEFYSVAISRTTKWETKTSFLPIYIHVVYQVCLLLSLNEKKETAQRKWREALCIQFFFHFLLSPSFSLRWSWDSLTFPLLRQVVSSRIFLSLMERTRGLLSRTKNLYNEKTRSLLFKECIMDGTFQNPRIKALYAVI